VGRNHDFSCARLGEKGGFNGGGKGKKKKCWGYVKRERPDRKTEKKPLNDLSGSVEREEGGFGGC